MTGAGDLFSTFYFTENEPGPALAIEPAAPCRARLGLHSGWVSFTSARGSAMSRVIRHRTTLAS